MFNKFNYTMNITLLSIIETIILMLPALLVVAYVTVAERKTMASMQRRLGPNAVGQINRLVFKRFYHSNDKSIEILYRNRKAPLKPFKGNILSVCKDLSSSSSINTYFKTIKGKGGIYMFTLKSNSNIFYIDRAKE